MKMNGHILPGTSICVDYWLWTPEKKYHHFLTHLHADHTVNLKSTFHEKIYTSPFNAWLLRRWFDISPECIVPLHVGDSHIIYDANSQSRFSVTLLDANHCPGSVMFLFQGDFGNILYTGDFRYNPEILEHPMLKSLVENEVMDKLYLDNTFAADHCEFPPRHEALKDVIKLIVEHPDHNILLGVRKLGKEEVLRAIALELKEKVCVSKEKLRILSKLGYESVFTTDSEDSRIFVKEMPHITPRSIDQLRAERGPVVTILLTALYSVTPPGSKYLFISEDRYEGIYKIPYSDHSSHSELVEFVSKIKPKEIYPIVSSSIRNKVNSSINSEFSEILSCTWQNSVIPRSITTFSRKTTACSVVIPVLNKGCVSGLTENVVSYMTEDDSENNCENMEKSQSSKDKRQSVKEQIDITEGKLKIGREPPRIVSKRNLSPRGSQIQWELEGQQGRTSQNSIQLSQERARLPYFSPDASEEYFTLSDEELSPLNPVADHKNNVISQQSVISKKENYMNLLEGVQTVHKSNVDSHLLNLPSTLLDGRPSIENLMDKGKQENFTPSTPVFTNKSTSLKKHLPTPKPNVKYTDMDEEHEEIESNRSEISGDPSEETNIHRNQTRVFQSCTQTIPVVTNKKSPLKRHFPAPTPNVKYTDVEEEHEESENNRSEISVDPSEETNINRNDVTTKRTRFNGHLSQSLVCYNITEQNLKQEQALQNFTQTIPLIANEPTTLKRHPPTPTPNVQYTDMEEEDKESESNGSEISGDESEETNHINSSKNVNDDRTNLKNQQLVHRSHCGDKTIQNVRESQSDDGMHVTITLSNPVQQNKSKSCRKHLPTPVPMNDENNMNNENNRLTLPSTKTVEDKHRSMKDDSNSSNDHTKDKHMMLNFTKSPLQFHSNNKEQDFSSTVVLASESKNIKIPTSQDVNEIEEKIQFRSSVLKQIFQSTSTTTKETVLSGDQAEDCKQNKSSSVLEIRVNKNPISKTPNLFDDEVEIQNTRLSILKEIFHSSSSPIIKHDKANEGQAHDYVHNIGIPNSEISFQMPKSKIRKYEDEQNANSGSDGTVSDLEYDSNCIEMFEALHRRNDEICKSSKNNPSTSKPYRVSEKFKHLLVKKIPLTSSGSGFFSPVELKKQKTTCTERPRRVQIKDFHVGSDSRGITVNKREENIQTSSRITKHTGTDSENCFKRQNLTSQSNTDIRCRNYRNEKVEFFKNFNIYKSWEEAIEKKMKSQKRSGSQLEVSFLQADR